MLRIGDYEVERALPARSRELAFAAHHVLLPRRARVIAVHPTLVGDHAAAVQLMRTAYILEALQHAAIPRVFECGLLPDRRPWIAIEVVEGPTVGDQLARDAMTIVEVIGLLRELGGALEHIHGRGIVHRGLCPAILVRTSSGLRVAEWGDAVIAGPPAAPSEVSPDPGGASSYQAPEVAAGEPSDARADVYALGVITYEALTRTLPTTSAARRAPGAPARLTALIDRMLDFSPAARPTSAEVHAEAIRIADAIDSHPSHLSEVDEETVEQVGVELVDISRSPPPIPPRGRIKWTPSEELATNVRKRTS